MRSGYLHCQCQPPGNPEHMRVDPMPSAFRMRLPERHWRFWSSPEAQAPPSVGRCLEFSSIIRQAYGCFWLRVVEQLNGYPFQRFAWCVDGLGAYISETGPSLRYSLSSALTVWYARSSGLLWMRAHCALVRAVNRLDHREPIDSFSTVRPFSSA
jgi:hypothetical protein